MKVKATLLIILIASILALAFHFSAIADIDAPHNPSNAMWCGSCHGYEIFWVGTGSYDALCQQCHIAPFCPISETGTGPQAWTHSSENTSEQYGEWSWECRNCHDPHYQKQIAYKNTDADSLYLASGTIVSFEYYNPDDYEVTYFDPDLINKSVLTYLSITYKPGWDATKITGKTWECRGTILFPNVNKLGYSYPVIGVDEGAETITVKGDVSEAYEYVSPPSSFAVMYGQYIKDVIGGKSVKFFDRKGINSFTDKDATYNGVCEICHTQTLYHKNDGSGESHYPAVRCTICHLHVDGFADSDHTGRIGADCEGCHGHDDGWQGGNYYGTTISHSTHTENDDYDAKGPYLACGDCHDINLFPRFKSGTDSNGDGKYDLSETDVCDTCHSPNGEYNGVVSQVDSIGAKTNWDNGVYQDDGTIASGKEKWCAGCHDNEPSVVNGETAPNICGTIEGLDYTAPGYYLGAHGSDTYGVNHQDVGNVQGACVHCHDVSVEGTSHGGQLFAPHNPWNQQTNFCFQCHGPISVQVGGVTNYNYGRNFGGDTTITTPNNIKDAFAFGPPVGGEDSGSSHRLYDIRYFIVNEVSWGYTTADNACYACHNFHNAQKNYPVTINEMGGVNTAVRRPDQHDNADTNRWGDEAGLAIWKEMMSEWVSPGYIYQAPYYYNSTTTFEPAGDTTYDGSNLPNFVVVCNQCHSMTTVYSTENSNYLKPINWGDSGDRHGKAAAPGEEPGGYYSFLKPPYSNDNVGQYVLSCTDCHEPHGSRNEWLLRTEVNGTSGIEINETGHWSNFCLSCHTNPGHATWDTDCSGCHYHGALAEGDRF